jgi:hypothetical protein
LESRQTVAVYPFVFYGIAVKKITAHHMNEKGLYFLFPLCLFIIILRR